MERAHLRARARDEPFPSLLLSSSVLVMRTVRDVVRSPIEST